MKTARALATLLAVLLGAPFLAAQTLVHTHLGAGAGSGLAVVTDVGDLNADGVPDLALGAPDDTLARGRVTLVSGATHATLFSVTGTLPGERFGAAIAPAGDVNLDGHDDLVVGAPGTLLMTGSARVLSGTTGATILTLTGPSLGSQFGAAVAGAGDVNGDGRFDLMIGAPEHTPLLGNHNGRVAVFSGANGSEIHAVVGTSGQHLGLSVSGWCTSDDEPTEIMGCTSDSGASAVQIRSRTTFALITTVNGPATGSAFGAAVARLGDTNDDGYGDVAVGAPGNGGSVTVLSGADWSVLFTVSAPATGTGFGTSVAAVGDVNGDGFFDLGCGAPLADKNGTDSGAVTIYSGDGGDVLYSVVGAAAGDKLGASVACAGDADADGRTEFAVAAPGGDVGACEAGQASIVALTTWNTVENGLPGLDGIPRLTGKGGLKDKDAANLELTSARPITGATLIVGLSLIVDAQNGVMVPLPDLVITGLQTTGVGTLNYDFTLTGLAQGAVVYQQFLLADTSAAGGVARSNTVAAKIP